MGSADIILDLISTGVTLRENNLKQIQGGKILESQGVLVANRQSLLERKVGGGFGDCFARAICRGICCYEECWQSTAGRC